VGLMGGVSVGDVSLGVEFGGPATEGEGSASATDGGERDATRRSLLYRWGMVVAQRPRGVLAAAVCLLVLSAALIPSLQRSLGPPNLQVQGSDSARVEGIRERNFPALGSEIDGLVFYAHDQLASEGKYKRAIAVAVSAMRHQPGVQSVLGPYDTSAEGLIAAGEHAAVAVVKLTGSISARFTRTIGLQAAATRAVAGSGVHAWLTGVSPATKDNIGVTQSDLGRAETIGLPVALLVLLLAMGAAIPAMLPLMVGVAGLVLTYGALAVLTLFFHLGSQQVAIVTLVGLSIGIDYAMFIISRFREELARARGSDGRCTEETVAHAVGVALATSGRTIVISGAVIALSLVALFVVSIEELRQLPISVVVVVACTLVVALTLLPATLALLGERINRGALPRRLRPASAEAPIDPGKPGGWARWAQLMMRHPILAVGISTAVLVIAATPVFDLRYGFNVGILTDSSTNSGKGAEIMRESFSPGALGPIEIAISGRGGTGAGSDVVAARMLRHELEGDSRVDVVKEERSGFGVLLLAVSSVNVDSSAATSLVQQIRTEMAPRLHASGGPAVLVGGATALTVDFTNEMRAKTPLVLALMLGLSLLLLMVVFRSIVLPIKAVLMNLLATAATLGIVVFVFQQGHGEHLLGFTSTGFIQSPLPLTVLILLYGLSMDYEVFLARRAQEEWRRTGDNRQAIAGGLAHTARPISAAAAIMVAIFGSAAGAGFLELKELGFALALAIALDATLVRLVLVPALMRLFGPWNWWLPERLEQALPGGEPH
jgi:putative drug exporter of the RND superfamily